MKELSVHLDEIRQHYLEQDWRWFDRHIDVCYQTMRSSIFTARYVVEGISTILDVCPYLVERESHNLARWYELFSDGVEECLTLHDYQSRQILDMFGAQVSAQMGMPSRAMVIFAKLLEETGEHYFTLNETDIWVGILTLQSQKYTEFDEQQLESRIQDVRANGDTRELAELLSATIYAYCYRANPEHVENLFEETITLWKAFDDNVELGKLHFVIGNGYRLTGDLDLTDLHLETARQYFSQTPYPRQHMAVHFELAQLDILRKNYAQAVQWLELSLRNYEDLSAADKNGANLANIYQSLGCVYSDMGDEHKACEYFGLAQDIWENEVKDDFGIAFVYNAYGYSLMNMKRFKEAQKKFEAGIARLSSVPDSPRKAHVMNLLKTNLDQLENDASLI